MTAWPCQNKTVHGTLCEGALSNSVHSRHHPEYHQYWKKKKPGLQTMSEGMRNYRNSAAHREAMELSAGATDCWPAAYGAPGECFGPITPSHTYSVGQSGDLKISDRYPVPPACSWHNDAMEQDADVRAWAERTYLTHNGRQYPFKISKEWLQAEKDGVRL